MGDEFDFTRIKCNDVKIKKLISKFVKFFCNYLTYYSDRKLVFNTIQPCNFKLNRYSSSHVH